MAKHKTPIERTERPYFDFLVVAKVRNRDNWTQPVSRDRIAKALRYYIVEAAKTSPGVDLLGDAAPAPIQLVEEAVADMFADWASGQAKVGGFIRNGFQRVLDALQAVYSALKGQGFTTAQQVFGRVERGAVGARDADRANGLDMSEAARQARAIEQGFLSEAAWQEMRGGVRQGRVDQKGERSLDDSRSAEIA